MTYHITYTTPCGETMYYSQYSTLRKCQNVAKSLLNHSKVFFNITVWEGCPGGIRIETYNERDFQGSQS
jgi:hypothetical protein